MLLLAYLALQVLVLLPHVSMTASMRQIVLLAMDVALPYFALSRACRNRKMIAEAMAAFVMAVVVLVPLAVFEFFARWMLYAGIEDEWVASAVRPLGGRSDSGRMEAFRTGEAIIDLVNTYAAVALSLGLAALDFTPASS